MQHPSKKALKSDSRTLLCFRCWAELCGSTTPEGSWQDSWRALEQLVASGQVLSTGLSQILTWVTCVLPQGHSNVMQM